LLKKYINGMHSSEIFDFWIEIELFRNIRNSKKATSKAMFIFDKYCAAGARKEVNFDGKLREIVQENMQNNIIKPNLFDAIQQSIFEIISTDCFLGVRKTEAYKKFKENQNKKRMTMKRRKFFCFRLPLLASATLTVNRTTTERNFRTYSTHFAK